MRMRQQCIPGRFSLPTKRPGNEANSIVAGGTARVGGAAGH